MRPIFLYRGRTLVFIGIQNHMKSFHSPMKFDFLNYANDKTEWLTPTGFFGKTSQYGGDQ